MLSHAQRIAPLVGGRWLCVADRRLDNAAKERLRRGGSGRAMYANVAVTPIANKASERLVRTFQNSPPDGDIKYPRIVIKEQIAAAIQIQ